MHFFAFIFFILDLGPLFPKFKNEKKLFVHSFIHWSKPTFHDKSTAKSITTSFETEILTMACAECMINPSYPACEAACNGHLACLQGLMEQGVYFNHWTTQFAAASGHLHCLRFLIDQGCAWDNVATSHASAYGHVDCLQFLIERGAVLDALVSCAAAIHGRLNCLQFIKEQGLLYAKEALFDAVKNEQLDRKSTRLNSSH